MTESENIQQPINAEEYPEKWREIFSLIERAGGPKLPNLKELNSSERFKVRMNWWAFFFGPIYYLIKGMWRKTITYIILMACVIYLVDFAAVHFFNKADFNLPGVGFGVIWAMLANPDYYKIKVLKQNKWI